MPRISEGMGPSNGLESQPEVGIIEEVTPSPGISSLTSENRPDSSGSSTGTGLQQPVLDAENLSGKGHPLKPAFSSVSFTDGSGQETGSGQASQPVSSEASLAPMQAIRVQPSEGNQLIEQAHAAFQKGDYATADRLLVSAGAADATLLPRIAGYRTAVANAQAQGPSEAVPNQGGFLTEGGQA